ncbi:MAG: hypothetical protein WC856_21525 [Methylococcaceae bacterium]|jgi:hypothetical protein
MSIFKYIYNGKPSALESLSAAEYKEQLIDIDRERAKRAFEMAWATRNFEIEMYWKRATYFWAFIASTFVGYFALIASENYNKPDRFNHIEVYLLICIGFVLSVAWLFTNIGSKTWQRHWETHVDLLENAFTGPLYKTIHTTQTYSVSKINEIVSSVFVFIWLLLGVKYLLQNDLIRKFGEPFEIKYLVVAPTVIAILAVIAMVFGHGRGRFGERAIKMYRRNVYYKNEN